MTDLIKIRCSSLSGWPDCGRRSAARMFGNIVERLGFKLRRPGMSIGASIGSSVHRGAEILLNEKAASGKLPPVTVATDGAIETLHEKVREDAAMMDRETPSLNEAEQQVRRMTSAYAAHVAPDVDPETIEKRLEARIPWAVNNLVLSGQSDVLAREPNRLRDLKTGKGRYGSHRPQFGGYTLLARTHGYKCDEIVEDFVQRVGLRAPQPKPIVKHYDLQGCEQAAVAVIRQIDTSLHVFLNGDPERGVAPGDPSAFTANPNSNLCSEKWCPAWGTSFCREHEGADTPVKPVQVRNPAPVPATVPETDTLEFL